MAILSEVDRQVVLALQVNGRASWRQIAVALGEPERTIARRGNRLVQAELVRVVALEHERIGRGDPSLLRLRCAPRMLREAAAMLAARSESLWVYTVAGANEAAAEIFCPPEHLSSFLLDEMSALPGLTDYSAHPVLRYFRTIDDWHPGLSDGSPVASLSYAEVKHEIPQFGPPIELSAEDRMLVNCLKQNGRMTHEELGSAAGMSKATAGRRVEALRSSGLISIRAVVEPALLGYPVEAILWIKAPPAAVESVGTALASTPEVRYAAAIGGDHQLIAQVAMSSRTALHSLLAESTWTVDVHSVETSIVMDVHKRSDIVPASYESDD